MYLHKICLQVSLAVMWLECCTNLWRCLLVSNLSRCCVISNVVASSFHSHAILHNTSCYCCHPQHQCSHLHGCHILLLLQVWTANSCFLLHFFGKDLRKLEGILPILTKFFMLGPRHCGGTELLKVQIHIFLICVQVSKRWQSCIFS